VTGTVSAIYTPLVSGADVTLVDLSIELDDVLRALPYPAYRGQLHAILTELADFHRGSLPGSTSALVDRTVAMLAPDAMPGDTDIELIAAQWSSALDDPAHSDLYPRDYNAATLCFALRHVGLELTTSPYLMRIWVASALSGWQTRPATPDEGWTDRPVALAGYATVEVGMLTRFIAAAKAAAT